MKKFETINDRLMTDKGISLRAKIHNSLHKQKVCHDTTPSAFCSMVPTIKAGDLMSIAQMTIDPHCQRPTIRGDRESNFKTMALTFDVRRYGRTTIGRVKGDKTNYAIDGVGRATVAAILGFSSVPVEILNFDTREEMKLYFYRQHEGKKNLTNWDKWFIAVNSEGAEEFKNKYSKALDIKNVLIKSGCVNSNDEVKWDVDPSKRKPSLEKAYTQLTPCITSSLSGQKGSKAGERENLAVLTALEIMKESLITEKKMVIHGFLLKLLTAYLTKDGALDLKRGIKSESYPLNKFNKRAEKLRKFLKKMPQMTGEEFYSGILQLDSVTNDRMVKRGIPMLEKVIGKRDVTGLCKLLQAYRMPTRSLIS
jgi:hypothetical protein